jgi:hypothetical protein
MIFAPIKVPVGRTSTVIDVLLFKVSWLALVIYQSEAAIPVLVIIVLRVAIWTAIVSSLAIMITTLVVGITMDLLLLVGGILKFPGNMMPFWLILLWLSFAITLPRGFFAISRLHPAFQSIAGSAAGCIGYYAGYLLGAVNFGYSLLVCLGTISFLWMLLVPFLFWIDKAVYQKYE